MEAAEGGHKILEVLLIYSTSSLGSGIIWLVN